MTYNVHEAKTNLSKLLEKAANGEEVVIAKDGKPVAKIIPIAGGQKKRTPGKYKGKIHLKPEFFAPMTPEELKDWGIE